MHDLAAILSTDGLEVLGETVVDGRDMILVGNAGSAMWSVFRQSPEFSDGKAHPLDRWSRRIGEKISQRFAADVVFPFEGPPWQPFQSWAAQSGQSFPSPVSMQLHKDFGLWHAYRFALIPEQRNAVSNPETQSPCLYCADQPCLQACPVDAFTGETYLVDSCVDYLVDQGTSDCVALGCAARRACPVGRAFTYDPEHAQFHMRAFLTAQTGGKQ